MAKFRRIVDWATPLVPAFDFATLARRLRQLGSDPCLARKQGKCEGRENCPDCAWSEGPLRERR